MLPENLLLQVSKPARYIGNEWNTFKKDLTKVDIKIALCFPDVYEVGMSHLGLRILYCLLNNREDIACERVFTPWVDMEDKLRSNHLELFSLESHTPLREFDIIGFSLLYEMDYTNVLNTLDLASIPLRSSERLDEPRTFSQAHLREGHRKVWGEYPLIIAGGICCLNPEPMVEFIDLFIIGEAEGAILEIVDVYKKTKHQKSELFYRMAQIEGVYVPSLYEVEYYPDGKLKRFIPKEKSVPLIIEKRIIADLNKVSYPTKPIVPFIEIIHDRISLEIMRGCPNRCRFCQARSAYFPKRERSSDEIVRLARESFLNSGYEEISLISLSTGDYSDLKKVVEELINLFKEKGISISLPSLKPDATLHNLVALICTPACRQAGIKKTGLTFAIEAGTERLREIIGKDINIEEFSRCLIEGYQAGWQRVKLYFLIGLPTETQRDLDGIIELATSASDLRRKIKGLSAFVTLSINSLIPKPHTPFQWLPMADTPTIREKQTYLSSRVKGSSLPAGRQGLRIKLNFHDYKMSFIEAVLSLGDRRLSKVIFKARQKGCKFDGWREHFNFDLWMEAFKDCSIDPYFYVNRRKDFNELLPWDHIDVGLSKEWLKREAERAGIIDKSILV